jgi:hypothetical protein
VLATRITAAAGVLAVLANAAVARADVPALLAVLPEACGRGGRGTVGPASGGARGPGPGGASKSESKPQRPSSRGAAANGAGAGGRRRGAPACARARSRVVMAAAALLCGWKSQRKEGESVWRGRASAPPARRRAAPAARRPRPQHGARQGPGHGAAGGQARGRGRAHALKEGGRPQPPPPLRAAAPARRPPTPRPRAIPPSAPLTQHRPGPTPGSPDACWRVLHACYDTWGRAKAIYTRARARRLCAHLACKGRDSLSRRAPRCGRGRRRRRRRRRRRTQARRRARPPRRPWARRPAAL